MNQEIISLRKSLPIFEKRLKALREGSGMTNFRYLKYETRNKVEQKQIEDALIEKLEKQKYDPFKLKRKSLDALLKIVSHHWANVLKIEKEIREKTLRKTMPNLSEKEIKEAMSKHESRQTLRFKGFQILLNKMRMFYSPHPICGKQILIPRKRETYQRFKVLNSLILRKLLQSS